MNIPKRLVFMCLVVFLLLAGCGTAGNPTPIIITATPGIQPTMIVVTYSPRLKAGASAINSDAIRR